MELQLDPVIPMHRKCKDGHVRFNRGYISPNRGKTFDEIFGKERSKEIRMKISIAKKSNHGYMSMRSKPCLAIKDGKIVAIFPSTADASRKMGCIEQPCKNTSIRRQSQRTAGDGSTRPKAGSGRN